MELYNAIGKWSKLLKEGMIDLADDFICIYDISPEKHEGFLLHNLRLREGMSQKDFARILEISQKELSDIERGKVGIWFELAMQIEYGFNVSPGTFILKSMC